MDQGQYQLHEMENPSAYSPLTSDRSIRLLRLAEGTGDDEIICYVATVELDDPVRYTYEALSYVWGDPDPGEAINFNGLPGKLLTPNLAAHT